MDCPCTRAPSRTTPPDAGAARSRRLDDRRVDPARARDRARLWFPPRTRAGAPRPRTTTDRGRMRSVAGSGKQQLVAVQSNARRRRAGEDRVEGTQRERRQPGSALGRPAAGRPLTSSRPGAGIDRPSRRAPGAVAEPDLARVPDGDGTGAPVGTSPLRRLLRLTLAPRGQMARACLPTGDRGGSRRSPVGKRIYTDPGLTQAIESGLQECAPDDRGPRYRSSADYYLTLDTVKLGLWPGGLVGLIGESVIGDDGGDQYGSGLLPTRTRYSPILLATPPVRRSPNATRSRLSRRCSSCRSEG